MDVLFLIPGCGLSGGIAVVCQYARRLAARGLSVAIADEREPDPDDLGWFGAPLPVVVPASAAPRAGTLVATNWSTAYTAWCLPADRRVYFVQADERGFFPDAPRLRRRVAKTYQMPCRYVTEAAWIRELLRDEFGQEAEVVPNGVDREIYRPVAPEVPRGVRPRVLVEGAVAQPAKGVPEALEAVGPLDCEVWLVSARGRPGPGPRVDRCFEAVPMRAMAPIYSACDVMLKMSRMEGFPGPPLEMMACGGALVMGRVSGAEAYARDGENCLLVPPGDVGAARAAVARLLDDAPLRDRLGRAGIETAARFDWEASAERMAGLLRP